MRRISLQVEVEDGTNAQVLADALASVRAVLVVRELVKDGYGHIVPAHDPLIAKED